MYVDGSRVLCRRVFGERMHPVPKDAVLIGRYTHPLDKEQFYDDLRHAIGSAQSEGKSAGLACV